MHYYFSLPPATYMHYLSCAAAVHLANDTETQKLSRVDKPTKIGCYGSVP